MEIEFYKYQGTGNDFILFDNRNKILNRNQQLFFKKICDRKFGIGADGIMLLETHPVLDFQMIYFNADGNEGSLCGNGSRCMIKFAALLGIISKQSITQFLAVDGIHEAEMDSDFVKLKMNDINLIKVFSDHFELNTGSPHFVIFKQDIDQLNVKEEGSKIRYSEPFVNDGINVNFVEKLENGIKMRTYERGVEDETLSCGTGVTAAALAYSIENKLPNGLYTISIKVLGGDLKVKFEKINEQIYKNVWLIGPAEYVYKGVIEIT